MFPEDFVDENDRAFEKTTYDCLTKESKNILIEYEDLFKNKRSSYYAEEGIRGLAICFCVLFMQMDAGCASETRCEFPYVNNYKYLLKRGMYELVEHVDWVTTEGRTKNKINQKKIEIQIFASEAYALINKNESHIRMSSSTWHSTRPLMLLTGVMTVLTLLWQICSSFQYSTCACHYRTFQLHGGIICILPLLMFCAVSFIRKKGNEVYSLSKASRNTICSANL